MVSLCFADNAPRPPANLRAKVSGPNSIELKWDPSAVVNGRKIIAYSIHYKATRGDSTEQQKVLQDKTSYKIEKLRPYTNYTFYVVAYNNESASQHSQYITQTTSEDSK